MPENVIRYEHLFQQAMRGLIRDALASVARDGLPEPHHFFLVFSTAAPGVVVSESLKRQYPEEMTIVLQHQFWNLEVGEVSFSVSLGFGPRQERLTIPYTAVRAFTDPGANPFPVPNLFMGEPGFGIQFLDLGEEPIVEEEDEEPEDDSVIMLDAFLKKDQ